MPASEVVDLVDADDKVVGRATLGRCLREGLLHRAVAVLVVRRGGELVLQRRSRNDAWHPGRWTLSCTGHVKSGEGYTAAAKRELAEELGIRSRVRPLGRYLLPKIRAGRLTEWEMVALYLCPTESAATPDPGELEEAREFDEGGVATMLAGRKLTPDARMLLREVMGRGLGGARRTESDRMPP